MNKKFIKNFINLSFLSFLIFVASCDNSNKLNNPLNDYFSHKPIKLKGQIINVGKNLIADPLNIILKDSLIFLNDQFQNKNYSLINKNEPSFIRRFGKTGRGPGEIIVSRYIPSKENNKLQLYLPNKKEIIEYQINNLTTQKSDPIYSKKLKIKNYLCPNL